MARCAHTAPMGAATYRAARSAGGRRRRRSRWGPRDRVVLTALATHAGRAWSAPNGWPTRCGGSGRRRRGTRWSRAASCGLRRALGAAAIETTPHGYRLTVLADDVDAHRFERLGRRGPRAADARRAGAGRVSCSARRWRCGAGRPLVDARGLGAGADRGGPARGAAARCRGAARRRRPASGQHREVLAEAQALVAEAPLRERRWALLALAQYQAGRQGEALRTLRQARTVLANELGVDPGPELVALEQAILRQDPSLVADDAAPEASAGVPVPRPVAVRRRRRRRVLRTRRRGRRVPAAAGDDRRARGGRPVGERQVVAGARRRGRRARSATAAGSSIVTPGRASDGRAHALSPPGRRPCWSWTSARRRSRCAPTRPSRPGSSPPSPSAPTRAPLVVALRADRLGDVSAYPAFARPRRARPVPARADGRGRPAGGDRGTGAPGRAAARAGPGRPARARGGGRAGRAAAAVPRAAPDLGAARRAHAHRRRLRADRRHPRRRRPVRRGGLRASYRRTQRPHAARPAAAPGHPGADGEPDPTAGCRGAAWRPTPTTSG